MLPPSESSQPDFDEVRRKADEFARHASADVFARFERLRSGLDVNLPIVSAIIEREHNGEKEILVHTRWKPERDPLYSGTLEIPAGGMHVYENVVWPNYSCGLVVVVFQEPPEPLSALDWPFTSIGRLPGTKLNHIAESLMTTFLVVMLDVLAQHMTQ